MNKNIVIWEFISKTTRDTLSNSIHKKVKYDLRCILVDSIWVKLVLPKKIQEL